MSRPKETGTGRKARGLAGHRLCRDKKEQDGQRKWDEGRERGQRERDRLVPSEMACFESSPGRIRRTAVWRRECQRQQTVDLKGWMVQTDLTWISLDEMVDYG